MRFSIFPIAGKNITRAEYRPTENGVYCGVPNLVGKKIRQLRDLKGLSQEELADLVGLSNSQISHLEGGDRDAKTVMVKKIADALGVSPAELFEGERPTPPVPSSVRDAGNVYFVMPGKISAEERERVEELLKRLAEIPNGDKDLIYDLINTVYKRSKSK